jgi:hypothetical protein
MIIMHQPPKIYLVVMPLRSNFCIRRALELAFSACIHQGTHIKHDCFKIDRYYWSRLVVYIIRVSSSHYGARLLILFVQAHIPYMRRSKLVFIQIKHEIISVEGINVTFS